MYIELERAVSGRFVYRKRHRDDPRANKWPEGFRELQEYFAANDTTRVLQTYKTPDGYPLGSWCSAQRSNYKKGTMPADRITLLENLGDWTWDTRA